MSYSNALMPNDEFQFPHPPLWLVWIGEETYYQSEYHKQRDPDKAAKRKGKGKVRHVDSLSKAKAKVSGYAIREQDLEYWNNGRRGVSLPSPSGKSWMAGEWSESWAIYEWTGEKYELRHEGRRGDFKDANPLFAKPLAKNTGKKERDVPTDEIEAAKLSILKAG